MNKLFGLQIRYSLIAALVLILSACVDPFNPDLTGSDPENRLVVEGFITNEDIPHKVTLSRTKELNTLDFSAGESGATVQIVDLDNNLHELTEAEAGNYYTDESEFTPEVGQSYQLKIKLADGEEYESDFQELLPVTPIDSLWSQQTTEDVVDGAFLRSVGVVKLFTNYEPHDAPRYYRYDYVGTYAVQSELQGNPVCWRNQALVPNDLRLDLTCYVNEKPNLSLNVSTYPDPTFGATGVDDIITISLDSRFILGYSVLVKKYSLTKGYHDFLDQVRDQSEFGGSIFDPPPTQIIGNIRNVNDPDELALGYFSTLSQTTKRIFIHSLPVTLLEGRCDFTPGAPPPDDIPKFLTCCDCREFRDAIAEKPEFWAN